MSNPVKGTPRVAFPMSDFNLGLRVTGGLTFGPKPGAIDKG